MYGNKRTVLCLMFFRFEFTFPAVESRFGDIVLTAVFRLGQIALGATINVIDPKLPALGFLKSFGLCGL